jgi:hypothetical protein
MSTAEFTIEQILSLAKTLKPTDRELLGLRLKPILENPAINSEPEPVAPRRPLRGLLADLGPAPSAEDIDEAKREMWGNFPREDF